MSEVGNKDGELELRDPHAKPEPPPPEEPPESELVLKKPRMWPFFLVVLAILGGVGFAVYRFERKPEPLRVLVAIDYQGMPWEGTKASARLSDAVCDLLKKVGFEPVKTGDPAVDKILTKAKTPEDAARSLKAAFVITGTLTPEMIEEKLPAGAEMGSYFEARVEGDVFIREIDDAADKVEKAHLSSFGGGPTKDEAIETVTNGISKMVFDEIAPRMMDHPIIHEVLDSGDVRLMAQIQDAKKFVERRKHLLDDVKKRYDDVAKAHASTPQAIRKITYYGSFDEDDSLAAVGPDGYLVQTANVSPFVSPETADLGRIIRLETLEWRRPDGGEPRVVWKGYHLYGYPSAAAAGSPVVFVEDLYGFAKTITVVEKEKARRIRIDPTYRFHDPQIAPGGAAVAMLAERCRDCPSGLLVMSLADGKTLHERQGDERYGGYAWLDGHRLAYFVKPPAPIDSLDLSDSAIADDKEKPKDKDKDKEPKDTFDFMVYDTESNAVRRVAGYDKDDAFAFPTASADGKLIAIGHRGETGQYLALIDAVTGKLTDETKARGGGNPSFSPDGSMVAYTEDGDIRLFHIKEDLVDELTKNPIEELYPKFSSDGATVFFESRDTDPNFSRNRYVRVIASVPVKP